MIVIPCRQLGQKLDIALVVSVGSGIFPAEDLGKTDAQESLYFGKHWLKAGLTIKARAKSLVTLLTTAVRVIMQSYLGLCTTASCVPVRLYTTRSCYYNNIFSGCSQLT